MVLQGIVDHYLNKILRDYIEDYSSDQFNLKFGECSSAACQTVRRSVDERIST